MTIVSSAFIFTDGNSFVTDCHIGRSLVDPGAGVVVVDPITLLMQRQMGVPAEDAVNPSGFGVGQCTSSYLGGEPQPAGVQPIKIAGEALVAPIELLYAAEKQFSGAAEQFVVECETVELVAVNGQVPHSVVGPDVALKDRNSHQVGHYLGESFVMVAFNPNDLDIAFAVREFSDVGEELPVIAIEPRKVEVGEDVAQEDQTAEAAGFQQRTSIPSAADARTEMSVRQEQRIKRRSLHAYIVGIST